MKLPWNNKVEKKRVEIFNFKSKECQEKFTRETSQGTYLSEVFSDVSENVDVQTKHFLKRFNNIIHKCFNKIRITKSKKNNVIDNLFDQRRKLKKQGG